MFDVLKDLYGEDMAAVETQGVVSGGVTYQFVVADWSGAGKAHFHTFGENVSRQEIIDWADKEFADGDSTFVSVEVSRMVETDDGDYFEVVEELQNSGGHLVPLW